MSKYTGNGQFTLNELSIVYQDTGDNEKKIDLSAAYVQFDLYESIFDQTMSGSVAIADSFNLQDLLPLYGDEQIVVDFHTQGNDANPIQYTGVVYKISEKHRLTEHTSGYTIYFISPEAIQSQVRNVQKAYQTTTADCVNRIYNTIVGPSQKLLDTIQTKSVDTYVFGTVKPLEAIEMLSKHSYSKNNEAAYVFYEDNKQFNFKPLQSLYKQEAVTEYKSRNKGLYDDTDQRAQEAFTNIQDIRVMEENSYLDRLMEGQHGAKFTRFDLKSKKLTTFDYAKQEQYDQEKSLGQLPFKKDLETSYQNKVSIRYGHDPKTILKDMSNGIMNKIELNTIRVELVLFGDSLLRCGLCVNANLPIWNKDQDKVTDMLTGKFLITELHHQFTMEETYMQTLMIQKEAYENL